MNIKKESLVRIKGRAHNVSFSVYWLHLKLKIPSVARQGVRKPPLPFPSSPPTMFDGSSNKVDIFYSNIVRGNDMVRWFFSPSPCPVTFRCPLPSAPERGGVFLHLVELCTCAWGTREESGRAFSSSCSWLSGVSRAVLLPSLMTQRCPCDSSRILITGHCASPHTLVVVVSLSTSCVILDKLLSFAEPSSSLGSIIFYLSVEFGGNLT